MKVSYTSADNRLTAEIEGEKQTDVFTGLARFQEVFEHRTCGKCSKSDTKFVVRNVDDNTFFEMHCMGCRARLAFGQHKGKDGTLFPKRQDKDHNWLPNGGWTKYNPETKKDE